MEQAIKEMEQDPELAPILEDFHKDFQKNGFKAAMKNSFRVDEELIRKMSRKMAGLPDGFQTVNTKPPENCDRQAAMPPRLAKLAAVQANAESASLGHGSTPALVVLWYTFAFVAIRTSEWTMKIEESEEAKVPLTICSFQFLTATLLSAFTLQRETLALRLSLGEAKALGAVSATHTIGFLFTIFAFSLTQASFVETVKAGEPISTVVLAYLMLGEREALATHASLLPVVIGAGMASSGEGGGSLAAFLATVGSNFSFSARAVFTKRLKRNHPISYPAVNDASFFFHVSWMGLLALLPLAILMEAGTLRTFASPMFYVVWMMMLNGAAYSCCNMFSFMVMSRVSASTHAVFDVCRRVLITAYCGTPLSIFNTVGIVVAVMGAFWFNFTKTSAANTIGNTPAGFIPIPGAPLATEMAKEELARREALAWREARQAADDEVGERLRGSPGDEQPVARAESRAARRQREAKAAKEAAKASKASKAPKASKAQTKKES